MTASASDIGITRNPIKLEIVEMESGYKPYIPGQVIQIKAKTGEIYLLVVVVVVVVVVVFIVFVVIVVIIVVVVILLC